jgi:hypothetical protein
MLISALIICLFINVNAQVPDWLWAQSGGGTSNEQGLSVITDDAGNVYVAGDFSSNPYAVFGSDTLTNISGPDIFIAKKQNELPLTLVLLQCFFNFYHTQL